MLTSKQSVVSVFVSIVIVVLAFSFCASADQIFSEDWESGIDPLKWTVWGTPTPELVYSGNPCDGSVGLDPNGDSWCPSGVWTAEPISWQPGCEIGMDFVTNVNLDPRQAHHQRLAIGLASGWETSGDCAFDGVEGHLSVVIEASAGVLQYGQRNAGVLFESPYAEEEDGICHQISLKYLPGGEFGRVVVVFDGNCLATVELVEALPEPLYLFVDGRSAGITNIVDNISVFNHPVIQEDWESGIDTEKWTVWGTPAPELVTDGNPCDGSTGVDPNGDGWCPSGMWSVDPILWGLGAEFGMDFVTNRDLEPRQAHHQRIVLGLTTGWEESGECAYDGVEGQIAFVVEASAGVIQFGQRNREVLFETPYLEDQDSLCHQVSLRYVQGGEFGAVELAVDGIHLTTIELQEALPEPLYLFVDGRSVGITNVVDNVFFAPGGCGLNTVSAELVCDPYWGTVPFTSTMSVSLTNEYPSQIRRIAGRIDAELASGAVFGNWRAGYTNLAPGNSYSVSWPQIIPALPKLIGDNVFTLTGRDVTPAPYNLPPYAPSGSMATANCTVTGVAP